MSIRRTLCGLSLFAFTMLAGCHAPDGGTAMFSQTGGPTTYVSTETIQKTVRIYDRRNGEVFFSLDIPPGKQLTFDFDRGDGDDSVYTPDLMRYEVRNIGDKFGRLDSAMTVPNAASRAVHVDVRQGGQYTTQSPMEAALRTDAPSDRPDWWTPRGGALPDDRRLEMYDN